MLKQIYTPVPLMSNKILAFPPEKQVTNRLKADIYPLLAPNFYKLAGDAHK